MLNAGAEENEIMGEAIKSGGSISNQKYRGAFIPTVGQSIQTCTGKSIADGVMQKSSVKTDTHSILLNSTSNKPSGANSTNPVK